MANSRSQRTRYRVLTALMELGENAPIRDIAAKSGISERQTRRVLADPSVLDDLRCLRQEGPPAEAPMSDEELLDECIRSLRELGRDENAPHYSRANALRGAGDLIVKRRQLREDEETARLREELHKRGLL